MNRSRRARWKSNYYLKPLSVKIVKSISTYNRYGSPSMARKYTVMHRKWVNTETVEIHQISTKPGYA